MPSSRLWILAALTVVVGTIIGSEIDNAIPHTLTQCMQQINSMGAMVTGCQTFTVHDHIG